MHCKHPRMNWETSFPILSHTKSSRSTLSVACMPRCPMVPQWDVMRILSLSSSSMSGIHIRLAFRSNPSSPIIVPAGFASALCCANRSSPMSGHSMSSTEGTTCAAVSRRLYMAFVARRKSYRAALPLRVSIGYRRLDYAQVKVHNAGEGCIGAIWEI